MTNPVDLTVTCEDFLRDNPRLYAHKAKRKKIALIAVQAVNRGLAEVRIELGAAKLLVGDQDYAVESPGIVIRKFSEFTWDFLVYSILALQPALLLVDAFFFLSGPLYNRRLRKQLRLLSDNQMVVGPGDCKNAILAFRGVPPGVMQLSLHYHIHGREREQITCEIR